MKKVFYKLLFVLGIIATGVSSYAQEIERNDYKDVEIKPDCKQIIGYFPSWQWYKRAQLINPATLDYSRYTILNYSFFAPDSVGNLFGTDAWADSVLLRGKIDWGKPQPAYFPNTSVIDYAHVWGVRVMVSIGGWTLSENFPKIAADPKLRAHFAQECVRLLKDYQFDGIDIDWEYPGYAEHKGTPADKENFTYLMQEIRDSIDAYGKKIKYNFYLTAAFGANASNMIHIEWDKISKIMDYINMMTYDFNGGWTPEANHNSPLYNPAVGAPGSLDNAYKLLTETYNVPAEKLNMGVAFYGRSLKGFGDGTAKIYATGHSGKPDDKTYYEDEGMPQYFNIVTRMKKFDKFWDDTAKVPYLISKDLTTFVSYDDVESIRLKAEYVKQKDMAGVIIWDCTGDYMETSPGSERIKGTPLVDVINDVLRPCKRKTIRKRWK